MIKVDIPSLFFVKVGEGERRVRETGKERREREGEGGGGRGRQKERKVGRREMRKTNEGKTVGQCGELFDWAV